MTTTKSQCAALSVDVGTNAETPPPKEFRVFKAGPNPTVFGTFTFDEAAAALVMAAAKDYANDYSIDYCHAMIDAKNAIDPEKAGKAAGWFTVEMRGGELWAVNVTWTPAATAALVAREYRYISQVFHYLDDGTICELVNIALTNTPANKDLEPLMASRHNRGTSRAAAEKPMNEKLKKMAKLAGLPDTATEDEVAAAVEAKLAAATATAKCAKCGLDMKPEDKFCAGCGAPAPEDDDTEEVALPPAAAAQLSRLRADLNKAKNEGERVSAELSRIEGERLLTRFETEAAGYKALGQEPKVFGKVLLSLHQKAPEEKKAIDEILKKANAALSSSPLFQQAGRGGDNGADTAKARVDKLVKEMMASDAGKGLTESQCLSRIVGKNPALYEQYMTEKQAA